ncbi:helix-turn-helix transcriptional regulator [Lacticaseibacillus sp. N501-2]|uniref:helix-turn-helix transcriptional regulator n=1 Tax=Lacticaseibacillus salsurae TaxID=3367729 RepID=UPI0038B275E0
MANIQAQSRLLSILNLLFTGATVTAQSLADRFGVTVRTAQRDLDQLQALGAHGQPLLQRLPTRPAGYRIVLNAQVQPGVVLMLEKMILQSRILTVAEMQTSFNALQRLTDNAAITSIQQAVAEEVANYEPITMVQTRARLIWQLQKAIEQKRYLALTYVDREAGEWQAPETLTVVPLAISFTGQYFLLSVNVEATSTIRDLHLDWISDFQALTPTEIAQPDPEVGAHRRFQAAGYRGKTIKIQFEYYGLLEYVFDRYPTAHVLRYLPNKDNAWPFRVALVEMDAEYSAGVRMWLIAQSLVLRVIAPQNVVDDVKAHLHLALSRYDDA